ncbi:MAG: alpha/beta hydrolase [Rubrivivax sp.]|nr:alpha/beta hydrolase [Rubrivivax sp.]
MPAPASRHFTTSDGVRLHYLEAGPARPAAGGPTLVLVPGWTMPAWVWQPQIEHFAPHLRVLALDPRGQGRSAIADSGYDYTRRGADIGELLAAALCEAPVVLVGWSLGVLESLQYLHDARQAAASTPVRGLVLVDNSVGVGDPPSGDPTFFTRLRGKRRETVTAFVSSMFKRAPDPAWQRALVDAALRVPLQASIDLLRQPRPREFWRDALLATPEPVLYAYTPKFAQQGEIVKARRADVQTQLFADAGHALFVDEAAAFNELLERFVARVAAGAAGAATAATAPAGASR